MKKMFLAVVALVAISSVAMAKSEPSSESGMAVIKNGSTVKLYYKAPEQNNVLVTIYDESNQIVFSEMFKRSDGFIRPYNFEKLDQGNYTIELRDEYGRRTEQVSFATSRPEEKVAKMVQLPGTEKYALLIPGNGAKSLSIDIYNQHGINVYSEEQPVEGDFAQLFNLEGLKSFTLIVNDSKGLSKTINR